MNNKQRLIKLFHTLLSQGGIDNETKAVLLHSYGVESSTEMTEQQLTDICNKLMQNNPEIQKLDAARRRLLSALKEWAGLMGYDTGIDYLKGIAERAAENTPFNKIREGRLNSLYAAFKARSKDIRKARELSPIAK